jgi:hypothetical protein
LGFYSGGILINSILAGANDADNAFYMISRPDEQGEFDVAGAAFGSQFQDSSAVALGCAPTSFGFPKAQPIKGSVGYGHALFVGVDWEAQTHSCGNADLLDTFILYSFNDPFNDLDDLNLARVTVSCFGAPDCVATEGEGGMDPETEPPLDPNDSRVTSAQVTFEGEREFLWVTQSIGAGTYNKPICRWYKIDLNGWPSSGTAMPFVDSSGTVGPPSSPPPPSEHPEMGRFYPAGIVDPSTGTLGVVFARSSPDEKASIRCWGRLANGTIFTPEVANPENPVGDTPNLGNECADWGDYFDVELGPDDGSSWGTGLYMKQGGEDPELWGTWIFRFTVD